MVAVSAVFRSMSPRANAAAEPILTLPAAASASTTRLPATETVTSFPPSSKTDLALTVKSPVDVVKVLPLVTTSVISPVVVPPSDEASIVNAFAVTFSLRVTPSPVKSKVPDDVIAVPVVMAAPFTFMVAVSAAVRSISPNDKAVPEVTLTLPAAASASILNAPVTTFTSRPLVAPIESPVRVKLPAVVSKTSLV